MMSTPRATRTITREELESLRDVRYHRLPHLRLRNEEEAARFVDEVGFCLVFGGQEMELPNLWEAILGKRARSLPPYHHWATDLAWRWKDSLPAHKRVLYGKFLHGKPLLVSLRIFPHLYALSENYGGLDDYLVEYEEGRLSQEAKRVYEALLRCGPLPTSHLRREAGLAGKANARRFERALVELQAGLKIVKVGISDANRWKYCYVYDLLPRWMPQVVEQARTITLSQARRAILGQYLRTVIAAPPSQIAWLFGWRMQEMEKACASLAEEGKVETGVTIEGEAEKCLLWKEAFA